MNVSMNIKIIIINIIDWLERLFCKYELFGYSIGYPEIIPVDIVKYDSLEELLAFYYDLSIDELANLEFCGQGFDQSGHEYRLHFDEYLAALKEMKCFGFCENNTNAIHVWIDENCPIEMIIKMMAHEYGHIMKPHYWSQRKEEMKAGRYEKAAQFAFNIAEDLINAQK